MGTKCYQPDVLTLTWCDVLAILVPGSLFMSGRSDNPLLEHRNVIFFVASVIKATLIKFDGSEINICDVRQTLYDKTLG